MKTFQFSQRQGHIESLEIRICMASDFAAADLNADHRLDAKDIDVLVSAIVDQTSEGHFDLNADQKINAGDVDFLVSDLLGTTRGDADLDGDVDFHDFLSLASGFGNLGGWSDGNFDLQPTVTLDDFLALAANFGFHRSTTSYTHHNLDGNRYVDGWGELTESTPIDIPLSFIPEWVLGTQLEDRQLWVALAATGEAHAFELRDRSVTEVDIEPDGLPVGAPPALWVSGNGYSLLAPHKDGSNLTHPIRFGKDLSRVAYIRADGHLVVIYENGMSEDIEINAMLDARLLSDNEGRLLVLTDPTTEVAHGVLGDSIEANSVTLIDTNKSPSTISIIDTPEGSVIEGLAPIWADIDADGDREVIVTLSSDTNGGQITIYEEDGAIFAQEPGIGRGSRWRHQLAVAPFGPRGELEFVDVLTPHIGGVIEFREFNERLRIVADERGNTSHVIRSRNLDMAVAADFDADGTVELLLPNQRRNELTAVSRTIAGASVDWRLSLNGVLSTNTAVLRSHNGELSIGVGRLDAVMRIFVT